MKSVTLRPLKTGSSITVLLILQCFSGHVSSEDDSTVSPSATTASASYGEWCDDNINCDESNLLSTWHCNLQHTCECPADRKGLTYDEEIKGCAVVEGFKCNAGDKDDKCVTNASCEGSKCTCAAGKTCKKEVKLPANAEMPKGYVPTKFDRKAFGIMEIEGGGDESTQRPKTQSENKYPYSLKGVKTSGASCNQQYSFFDLMKARVNILIDFVNELMLHLMH